MRTQSVRTAVVKSLTVLVLGLAGHAPLALAKERGYSEIYYMNMDMGTSGTASNSDAKPGSVQLRLGTTFAKYVGLEGVFALGLTEDDFSPGNSGKLNTLFGADAVAIVPMADRADFLVRLGLAQMDVDVGSQSYDDAGVMYSVGFDIRTSRYGAVALEYQVLPDVDLNQGAKLETTSINLGFRLRF